MKEISIYFLFFIFLLIPIYSNANTYLVSEIKFQGFKSYDQYDIKKEDIKKIILDFSSQHPTVDKGGLYELAGLLAQLYQNKGLVFHRVHVFESPPATIRLITGVMSKVHVRNNKLYNDKQLLSIFNPLIGQLVDSKTMTQAVLKMNALPGFEGFAYLSVGKKAGEAQLNVSATDENWGHLSTRLSNYGSNSTGLYRINSQLTLNNIFKLKEHWQFGVGLSDELENWSSNGSVSFNTSKNREWVLSANYQNIVLAQDFSLLDMSGTQANVSIGFSQSWFGKNNRSKTFNSSLGYITQQLTNKNGITGLDITVEDVPLYLSFELEKASTKRYSNFKIASHSGWLFEHQSPISLNEEVWSAVNSNYSFVQSIFGLGIQKGIDFNLNIKGQYALTDLPSHRRFALSGRNKVASIDSGLVSADSAWFVQSAVKYFDLDFWKIDTVFELQAQIGQGVSQDVQSEQVVGLGVVMDFNIGSFKTKTKWFTDEKFEKSKLWFELSYDFPGGL